MNIDIMIAKIMNTPPYQLPPITHGNGVYQLDIQYLGEEFNKIGFSVEEVMEAYFHFVTKVGYKKRAPADSITQQPVKPGSRIRHREKNSHHR
jgi:hypothetical protein